jgi:Alw26I/Eco31I/Esp3I family type II restriction endonuclease
VLKTQQRRKTLSDSLFDLPEENKVQEKTAEIQYGDSRRAWNKRFVDYMDRIVAHPNYQGMPAAIGEQNQILWMAPSGRKKGSQNWNLHSLRKHWWAQKADELGILKTGKWISKVAKQIHPFGEKPCQTCGNVLKIAYVYPTRKTIDYINRLMGSESQFEYTDFLTIYEIAQHAFATVGKEAYLAFEKLFPKLKGLQHTVEDFLQVLERDVVSEEPHGKLSPGSMSNAPDRLDGFHTYNLCCRDSQDTGRTSTNLSTYNLDRRAFEHWAEGDWATADFLMTQAAEATCPSCGKLLPMTADHIGPISLGFQHRARFKPLCSSCNSAKSNRMTFSDVQTLLQDENDGQAVMSWQGKILWDTCKNSIKNDKDARVLSSLLRVNQDHFIRLLYSVFRLGYADILLSLLSPEYSGRRAKFAGLNPADFTFTSVEYEDRQDTYARSKATRLIRIAFDSLHEYTSKTKRNLKVLPPEKLAEVWQEVTESLNSCPHHPLRAELIEVLTSEVSPEARSLRLVDFLQGKYKVETGFNTHVLVAFKAYMATVGSILAERFSTNFLEELEALDDSIEIKGSKL